MQRGILELQSVLQVIRALSRGSTLDREASQALGTFSILEIEGEQRLRVSCVGVRGHRSLFGGCWAHGSLARMLDRRQLTKAVVPGD